MLICWLLYGVLGLMLQSLVHVIRVVLHFLERLNVASVEDVASSLVTGDVLVHPARATELPIMQLLSMQMGVEQFKEEADLREPKIDDMPKRP